MDNLENIVKININELIPNKYQPRKYFDENSLTELANSIKNYGILNPILVRKENDKYEIIAGERRFRAAKLIGLNEVPVIIKDANEQQSAEIALIENLERQDLTAIESAKSYEEIIKLGNHTQSDLAKKLGISQSAIANKMRLLTLPNEIQDAVMKKQISERHARCLLDVNDNQKQLDILKRIIDEKLTVKETEEIVEIENITDADVSQAINDVMRALNMNEEEEKESEKMNNGNFFPNYDNNMNQNNNIPNMNQAPIQTYQPEQENVMPTNMAVPSMTEIDIQNQGYTNAQPIMEQLQPQMPQPEPAMFDQPLFNPDQPSPIQPAMEPVQNNFDQPLFNNQAQSQELIQPQMPQIEPAMLDQPLFNLEQPVQPVMEPVQNNFDQPLFNNQAQSQELVQPQMPQPEPVMFDQPLFSLDQPEPAQSVSNNFEIPVVETIPQQNNKMEEVEKFLNNNGIGYKKYTNATGSCIIIEI